MKKYIKTFEEIQEDFDSMYNMSCKPTTISIMKEGYVIDEDKSVKWNREQVNLNNGKYKKEVQRLSTLKNKARDKVYDDIYQTIQYEVGHDITKEKAQSIFSIAYSKGHAYGFREVVDELYELIALAKELLS